jgi:pimeloyl-ACP methyl ester carboxylesterase
LWFQQQGVTVLLYDNRCIGASDGEPRNDVKPAKLVEDYHDALTFMASHPMVDEDKITLYGYSFSAMTALVAAALDCRVGAVISVTPIANYNFREEQKNNVMALAMQDRVSCIAGNDPVYIPFVDDDGLNPAGWGNRYNMEDFRAFLGTSFFTNQTTVQSYYHVLAWQPYGAMHLIRGRPALMVTPAEDTISTPADQKAVFDMIGEPKEFDLVAGRGHMNVINGEGAEEVLQRQLDFMRKYLKF